MRLLWGAAVELSAWELLVLWLEAFVVLTVT